MPMKLNLSDRQTAQLPDASAITLLNALRDRLSASGTAEHPLFT